MQTHTQPEAAAAPAAVPRAQVIARAQGTATDGTIQTSHGVIGMMILRHCQQWQKCRGSGGSSSSSWQGSQQWLSGSNSQPWKSNAESQQWQDWHNNDWPGDSYKDKDTWSSQQWQTWEDWSQKDDSQQWQDWSEADDSQQWPTWQDWAEQSYSWANWAAPPKTDRSLVRGWESLQRRKIRRELQRQNKPVPPKLQPKNLDLKRLSKGQQAERQSLQRELYQLEKALMRTRDKKEQNALWKNRMKTRSLQRLMARRGVEGAMTLHPKLWARRSQSFRSLKKHTK